MGRDVEWRVYAKRADFKEIGERLGISPVMARVLVNRGLDTPEKQEEYLYGSPDSLPDAAVMKGIPEAVALLQEKLREKRPIRIISDYDVDGVTSNFILYDGLKALGAEVTYDIPDRIRDGYGINVRLVEEAHGDGIDTLLTCDNGISAFEAIDRAKELGMTVIVTDHHQVQERLPDADVIVNPWQPLCPYPYKTICGAEVAYKLMKKLAGAEGKPLPPAKYLDFVALGTVCDVMPLTGENRILVREGMRYLSEPENPGLRALVAANDLLGSSISAYHLGFRLGPCINSEGRLSSAKEAMRLFLTEDPEEADRLAQEMKRLNDERKNATAEGVDRAVRIIEEEGLYEKNHILMVVVPELHESLAGIVAGRIREKYYRPSIIFTEAEDDPQLLKGSGRSIEEYNLFEALNAAKDHIERFGGHPMAAGLTIRKDQLEPLRAQLNEEEQLTEDQLVEKIYIDVPMPLSYVNLDLAEQLEQLEPFGTGNSKPLFAQRGLQLEELRTFGGGKVAQLAFRDERGQRVSAKAFFPESLIEDIKMWSDSSECDKISKYPKMDIMYKVQINDFRGERTAECIIENYRKSSAVQE